MPRNDRKVTRRNFLERVGAGAGTLAVARFCHGASGAHNIHDRYHAARMACQVMRLYQKVKQCV